jgi:hypothetical protein
MTRHSISMTVMLRCEMVVVVGMARVDTVVVDTVTAELA